MLLQSARGSHLSVSTYQAGQFQDLKSRKSIADFLDCTVEWLNSEVPASDRSDMGLKNVSVEQAAKMLGKSEQFVRVALQMGTAPFGFAAKNKTVWSYHISPKKLTEYIGEGIVV